MKKLLLLLSAAFYLNTNAQIITTIAGGGNCGSSFCGDGGAATAASFYYAYNASIDAAGNIYVIDQLNSRIRKVTSSGIITTIAGNGSFGYGGDGGPATAAALNYPYGIVLDATGNIYIAENHSSRIRKINTAGIISTFAGIGGSTGYSGDGGPATAATLGYVMGIDFDALGNLYIADNSNNVIRKVNTAGIISTFAGTGTQGYTGDGGQANVAKLHQPFDVATDAAGNLYIADYYDNVIRKVNSLGVISTFAGTGTQGYSGDGGIATAAQLDSPESVAVDVNGNVYIADARRIRMVNTVGTITTFAGNGTASYSGDGGIATNAGIPCATGIALDASSNLYITDICAERVRKVTICTAPITITVTGANSICLGSTDTLLASGASTYTWSANAGDSISASTVVSPTINTTYSVTGINGGCIDSTTFTLTVDHLPTISFTNVNPLCIIQGNTTTTTITANGASTYTWSANAGGVNTNTVVVSPSANTVYTVAASNGACNSEASYSVNIVSSLPTITITAPDTVCTSAINPTLTASGAQTYTWGPGVEWLGTTVGATFYDYTYSNFPSVTHTYTVTGTDANGCSNTATHAIVFYQPTVTVTSPHLMPSSYGTYGACGVTLDTLTAHGAQTYTWWHPSSATTPTLAVNYSGGYNQVYIIGYGNLGCSDSVQFTIFASQPSVSYTLVQDAAPQTWDAYPTYSANITQYLWSWGDGTTSNTSYPSHTYSVAGTYSICVTVTDTFGCSATYCQHDSVYRLSNTAYSNMVYINILHPTSGVNKVVNNNEINIYPNPAQTNFTIETNTNEKQTLQLFDVNGKLILTQPIIDKTIIDVSHLNAGVYNLSLLSNADVMNKKIIIIK